MTQRGIVLVASVSIFKDEEVLMIKENKPGAVNKWNFPGGRMEAGEEILSAARREVREETGLDVELTGTTGIYTFTSSAGNQVILFHFIARITSGVLHMEEEIIDSKWAKVSDLVNVDHDEFRDGDVIKQIINRLHHHVFYSLDVFHETL
ncbi:MAG TPA: NUDIX domain-containing protein [Candidatus Bathyarchaeia archaeon]|nr:NUDIX domain-containing protein [Candidatus Bathyarchaeia archaeon]